MEIISQMGMSLREMARFLKASKFAAYKYTDGDKYEKERVFSHDDGTSKLIAFCIIVPIILGLKITDYKSFSDFINGKDGSWLRKIVLSDRFSDWIPNCLLEENEAYSKVEGKTLVKKETKVDLLYEAIFVKEYDNIHGFRIKIGKGEFDANIKKEIMKAISLTSRYFAFSSSNQ